MNKNKKRYDKYKKFDVVYADFGRNPHGVQGGIRPVSYTHLTLPTILLV